jgi:ABC-type phosphate transport system substrate-binding protein
MKTRKLLIISVLILLSNFGYSKDDLKNENQPAPAGHINIICSDEMKSLAGEWANGFSSQNPSTVVNIKNAPVSEITLNPGLDIAIVNEAEGGKMQGWKMTVGREVTVPVINSSNPFKMTLEEKGLSLETLRNLFTSQSEMN